MGQFVERSKSPYSATWTCNEPGSWLGNSFCPRDKRNAHREPDERNAHIYKGRERCSGREWLTIRRPRPQQLIRRAPHAQTGDMWFALGSLLFVIMANSQEIFDYFHPRIMPIGRLPKPFYQLHFAENLFQNSVWWSAYLITSFAVLTSCLECL